MPISAIVMPFDDYVFLLGRPPVGEFLGFVKTMAVDGQSADLGLLTTEWRDANDRVKSLQEGEAGQADNAPLQPLAPSLESMAERVLADPALRRDYGFVPTQVAVVELDRLVVFQKFINLGFVNTLKASLPKQLTEQDVGRFAFGLDRSLPAVQFMQSGGNTYSFISPSNDFRFLKSTLVQPQQVVGVVSAGRPTAGLVLEVGYGSNYLNVLRAEGRLVLNNGSHRAYALRELGVTHVPCLVQNVTRREELELVASGDVKGNPDRYLKDPRPPLLKDYFDGRLRKVIPVSRKNRLVRIQFVVEQTDVPAA